MCLDKAILLIKTIHSSQDQNSKTRQNLTCYLTPVTSNITATNTLNLAITDRHQIIISQISCATEGVAMFNEQKFDIVMNDWVDKQTREHVSVKQAKDNAKLTLEFRNKLQCQNRGVFSSLFDRIIAVLIVIFC